MNIPGSNKRFSDSFSGRGGLLSCVERHHLGGQRGECSPLYQAAGPDYPEKHSWDEAPAWDPQWEGFHLQQYAGAEFSNVKCFFTEKIWQPSFYPKIRAGVQNIKFWTLGEFGFWNRLDQISEEMVLFFCFGSSVLWSFAATLAGGWTAVDAIYDITSTAWLAGDKIFQLQMHKWIQISTHLKIQLYCRNFNVLIFFMADSPGWGNRAMGDQSGTSRDVRNNFLKC